MFQSTKKKINQAIFIVRRAVGGGRGNYLVRFSFTRLLVRMTIVSCKYFIRGATAWKESHIDRVHVGKAACRSEHQTK